VTPARAAEVLRMVGNADYRDECVAGEMGADALELVEWLFGTDEAGWLRFGRLYCSGKHHGWPSFEEYARAEWEKERKG